MYFVVVSMFSMALAMASPFPLPSWKRMSAPQSFATSTVLSWLCPSTTVIFLNGKFSDNSSRVRPMPSSSFSAATIA